MQIAKAKEFILGKPSKLGIGIYGGAMSLFSSVVFNWNEIRHLEGSDLWVELGSDVITAIITGLLFGLFFLPSFRFVMIHIAKMYRNIRS